MKRDLKINYGVLDEIIAELQTYKKALEGMKESLIKVQSFMQTNEGRSIEAWNQRIDGSTDEIKKYKTQVNDLLSLFENYVTDTTAYISPIARNTMMRVDRNDIWANLNQIESGVTSNVTKALNISYQSPASLFGLFEDPTDAQKEASAFNKRQLESIQSSIQSTQTKLQNKMDDLWDLYNTKVKPFENADDAYNDLAANIKSKYTSFFEGLWDVAETIGKGAWDLVNGLIDGVIGMITGLLTVAGDLGIIVLSGAIPDPIEPAFLRDKAEETADSYKQAVIQFVKDPMRAVESVAQSVTDTVEEKGIMYVTGTALPAVIPSTWGLKGVKAVSKFKGAGKKSPNVAGSKFPYSKEFIQNKINAAKEGLGKVKMPVVYSEVVSTGNMNIPVFGAEMKRLSEIRPQMFSVKSVDGRGTKAENAREVSKDIKENISKLNKKDLDEYRKELNVPETNTVAVGKTNINGLENVIFKGASPEVRNQAKLPSLDDINPNREFKAPYNHIKNPKLAQFTRHAEEDVLNEFNDAIKKTGLDSNDVKGTLYIHQSNPRGVCNKCTKGLIKPFPEDKCGIFYQASKKYPNLKIVVTSEIDKTVKVNGLTSFTLKDGKIIQ